MVYTIAVIFNYLNLNEWLTTHFPVVRYRKDTYCCFTRTLHALISFIRERHLVVSVHNYLCSVLQDKEILTKNHTWCPCLFIKQDSVFSALHIATIPTWGYSAAEMSLPLSARRLAHPRWRVLLPAAPTVYCLSQTKTKPRQNNYCPHSMLRLSPKKFLALQTAIQRCFISIHLVRSRLHDPGFPSL